MASRFRVNSVLLLCCATLLAIAQQRQWGRPVRQKSGACFYREASFSGDYFCLKARGALALDADSLDRLVQNTKIPARLVMGVTPKYALDLLTSSLSRAGHRGGVETWIRSATGWQRVC